MRAWVHCWGDIRAHIGSNRAEWVTAFLLSGIGLVIRVVGLGSFPDMMAEDEGYFAYQAANLSRVDHWIFNPFRYDVHGHPLLFHVMQAVSIELFGQTVTAARLPSALIGTLTIASTYFMARVLFDRRTAVISAVFMMAFPLHVHFSRLALNQVMDAFFVTLVIGFLALALTSRNRIYYSLAGVTMGLSQYGFSSARLIPVLALLYLIHWQLRHFKYFKQHWREECWLILITVMLFFITVLPMISFLASHNASISPRLDTVGIWQKDARWGLYDTTAIHDKFNFWAKQFTYPLLGFVQMKETGYFYGRFNPFLGWFAPVPFLVGILMAVRHLRQSRMFLLVIWCFLSAFLGGTLLTKPPEYQRFIIATPAMAVLVSLGVIYISESVVRLSNKLNPQEILPRAAEYWSLPIILIFLLVSIDTKIYFQDYRKARPYFADFRTENLNLIADDVLPTLASYRVWYLPSPDMNLGVSPILKYKAPNIEATEFNGEPQELIHLLQAHVTVYHQSQAVIVSPRYAHFAEVYELLSALAEPEQWVYPKLGLGPLLVYVFRLPATES